MGLDLTLYAASAVDDIDVNKRNKWIELAYGRKTWFIWDYFKNLDTIIRIKDDQILTIPKEAWEDFVGVLDRNRERISSYSALNVDNLSAEELVKADQVVRNILDDPNYIVILEASY